LFGNAPFRPARSGGETREIKEGRPPGGAVYSGSRIMAKLRKCKGNFIKIDNIRKVEMEIRRKIRF